MDDLVMAQKEQEQGVTKKETGSSGNKSSGSGGNGTVDLDYAPIAPEMPTVEAEERKGSKSSKAKKRKRSEKRHFSEEQKKILRETPDDLVYSSGLGKTGNIDRKFTKSDSARLWRKDELLNSADFEEAVDHTKKFQSILDKLRKYALLDATGMEQKLGWDDYYNVEQDEAKALNNVLQELEAWRVPAPDDDAILTRERGLCEAY